MSFSRLIILGSMLLEIWAITALALQSTVVVAQNTVVSQNAGVAQNTGDPSFFGRVRDAELRTTLPGATVMISQAGKPIKGDITDSNGQFSFIDIDPGTYVVTTSFLGYESKVDTLQIPRKELLDILLQPTRTLLKEVLVETARLDANRFVAGLETVRTEDLTRVPMPDVSYDLAGYLLTLPGVVSTGDRGGQLFIRGGTPTQNLVLVDGMRIFQPFHIVGFYSAFPADIISYADVYAGGFSARYGGRISSVIDIKTINGSKEKLTYSASIAPFLSGFNVSIPIRPGDTSLLISARESIIDRISPSLLGQELPFRFGDRYVKLHSYLNQTSSLTLTALSTSDEGNLETSNDIDDRTYRKSTWKNKAFGGKYQYIPPESAVMTELSVYYSSLKSRYRPTRDELRTADVSDLNLNIGFIYLLGPSQLHFGIFGNTNFFDYKLGSLGTEGESGVTSVGSFFESQFNIGKKIRVEPGVRLEIFSRGLKNTIAPRGRITFLPSGTGSHNQFSLAGGVYHQQIVGLNNEQDVSDVFTIWSASPTNTPVPKAVHLIGGWKGRPRPWLELTLEGYRKNLSNISFPVFGNAINKVAEFSKVDGFAHGVDSKVEVTTQNFFFSLSVSKSKVEYHRSAQRATGVFRPNFGQATTLDENTFNPPHDRREQVNAMVQYRMGASKFSLRWQYGSGLPFTQVNGYYADLSNSVDPKNTDYVTENGTTFVSRSELYGARLPTYHRLDMTVERSFLLPGAELTAMAGVINVYDRNNIFEYNIFTGSRIDQLPIIPSVGIRLDVK
jgi:hypothetical protein